MRKIMLAALLALGACSGTAQPRAELGAFVVEDLRNARSMAERTGDLLALQCYDYLIPKLEARLDIPAEEEISGAISAYQKARNVRRLIEARDSVPFRLACGPLLADSEAVLRRWGVDLLSPF